MNRIHTETKMTLSNINDFYFYEALLNDISNQKMKDGRNAFRRSVEKLEYDVREAKAELEANLALRIFTYLWSACIGEARHSCTSVAQKWYAENVTTKYRGDAFTTALEFEPNEYNFKKLHKIFGQKWRSGYGGKNWKHIVEAMEMYGKVSNATFIDHVVDLEHNNGTVFSKDEAEGVLWFSIRYDGDLFDFLNHKFSNDILRCYYNVSITPKTERIILRWANIFGEKPPKGVHVRTKSLGAYSVEWGTAKIKIVKKWKDWQTTRHGNEPDARKIVRMASYRTPYPADLSEISGYIKNVKRYAIAWMRGYETEEKLHEVDKLLEKKAEYWKNKLPWPKANVTYNFLPCKAKNEYDGQKMNLQIQFPIDLPIGKKTEYGTLISTNTTYTIKGKELGYDGTEGWMDCAVRTAGDLLKITGNGTWFYVNSKELESVLI